MSRLVPTNLHISSVLESVRDVLNGANSLRLYTNPLTPSPATTLLQLAEATFPGYYRANTSGIFGPVFKVADGIYQTSSSAIPYTVSGPTSETIYGFFFVIDLNLRLVGPLPAPIILNDGDSFSIVIDLQEGMLIYDAGSD